MAYPPLPNLDDLSVRQWTSLTEDLPKTIDFCQRVGLLHTYPTERCPKLHDNWYLGACSKSIDQCKWRCRICKSSRSLRKDTFFEGSKLKLQQILDLMMYWCQGLDSHKFVNSMFALNMRPLSLNRSIH